MLVITNPDDKYHQSPLITEQKYGNIQKVLNYTQAGRD